MRRFFAAVLLLLLFALPVSAAAGVSSMESHTAVTSDGTCQVTLIATIHLDQAVQELTFPIPLNASGVTLNGSHVSARRSGNVRLIDLSDILGGFAGDSTINISYTLAGTVSAAGSGNMRLQLPLLSGFAYPVQSLSFSVTLPGEIPTQPTFSSGYHQGNIERDLSVSVSGATVSGSSRTTLKDHETLTMTLLLPEEMFPRTVAQARSLQWVDTAILAFALVALAYWVIFLRASPIRRLHRVTPPEGFNAGRMGTVLQLQGADLTLMVLSWAQLGYILIQIDRNGHAILHKRMDMESERSPLEQQYFRWLFRKRRIVDTSGLHYAKLSQKLAKQPAGIRDLVQQRSGNLKLFRAIAAGVGLCGGLFLGRAMAEGSLRYLLAAVLGVFGAVSSWHIQSWSNALFCPKKQRLYVSLAFCALWLLLSIPAGELALGIGVIVSQLIAGLLAAFGGRRTDLGQQASAQAIGLRQYMKKVSREELQRIQKQDPEYFFTLAPYALALDADKAFAKRFGSDRLPGCPYLTTGLDRHMTALEWSRLIRRTAEQMDARRMHLPIERILGVFHGITRP